MKAHTLIQPQFQRSADILRRVLQFDHVWKPFDMKKELGPPKSEINIDNLITDINTRAFHKLVKIVEASILQRLRYEKEMNRSYPSRINRRLMNRYTKPVPIKEKAKFRQKDLWNRNCFVINNVGGGCQTGQS